MREVGSCLPGKVTSVVVYTMTLDYSLHPLHPTTLLIKELLHQQVHHNCAP